MSTASTPTALREAQLENATHIAVVAALSATTMLFASLTSAYLVRRSFIDWRPVPALWPLALLAFASLASAAVEVVWSFEGKRRRAGFATLAVASGLYLVSALMVIASIATKAGGLGAPHNAFVVLLLSVHVAHALLGMAFSAWTNNLNLARLVTHFLTALLFAIVFVLFVLA